MRSSFLVVLALLCGNALCVKYQANVVITNDPYMPYAKINAELSYQNENKKHTAFFRYTNFGMSEFINYTGSKRLIYCTACESETIGSVDYLDIVSGATKQSVTDNNGCTKWTRSGETVKEVWAKSNSEICKVVFANGKIYTYSNFNTNPPADRLVENSNWKCPQPVCTKSVDVVLVLDRSGSIDANEWKDMVSFAKNVIDSFDASTARFGISTFATQGAKGIDLTSNVQSVKNKLDSYGRPSGNTCIGCGIKIADDYLKSARADATKIMVVFSDGADCSGRSVGDAQHYQTASTNAKNNGITIISVGIGNGIRDAQMQTVASKNSKGEYLYIKASSFSNLKNILAEVVKETCKAAPDTYKSCGTSCKGFCSCNQQCKCPTCETSDSCTKHSCDTSNPNAGCKRSVTQCPKDLCYNIVCNPSSGCVSTPVNCSYKATKDCHEAGCDSSKEGCFTKLNVNKCAHKPCHTVQCTLDRGCVYTPVVCDKRNCYDEKCNDKTDKCEYTARPCVEKDTMCEKWKCNTATNKCDKIIIEYPDRLCYNKTCDPAKGAVYTLFDKCPGDVGACEQKYCDLETGLCKTASITDCDVCKDVDCSNKTDKCGEGRCRKDKDGNAECYYEQTVHCIASCAEGLVCNKDTGNCDEVPGQYVDKCAEDTKDNKCIESKCDIEAGKCVNTTRDSCNDQLPCYIGTCDPESNECKYEPVCGKSEEPCMDFECVPVIDGGAECVPKNRTCEVGPDMDFNPECEVLVCNKKTDKCEVDSSKCDPCKGVVCEDGDLCTIGVCEVENGTATCKFVEKCPEGDDYCNPVRCNVFGSCVVEPNDCRHLNVSSREDSCYKAVCVSSAGECRKAVIEGAFTDVCGKCIQSFGDNETELKEKLEDTTCIGALRAQEFAAALTGAAIAGIIIACVVVAAIIATAGYFGTKELIRRAKMAQDQSANNNPLYEGNDNEMSNPSYAGAE